MPLPGSQGAPFRSLEGRGMLRGKPGARLCPPEQCALNECWELEPRPPGPWGQQVLHSLHGHQTGTSQDSWSVQIFGDLRRSTHYHSPAGLAVLGVPEPKLPPSCKVTHGLLGPCC